MSDAFVVCAMTLVAVALGTGLHLQLAISVMHAVAAAASIWFGLFVLHLAMGRVQRRTAAARRAPVQKPRPDLGRLSASPAVQRRRQLEASEPPPLPMTAARQTAHDGASERMSGQDGTTS
ncbi:MAG TPA: hypothetical protein VF051_13320, partial [Hyphomicrobiaceae bacterium]